MPRLLGLHAQGAPSLDSSLGVAHGKYQLSAERRKYDSAGRGGEEGKWENALLWGRGGILFHFFFFYYQGTTDWGNRAITGNNTWDTCSFPDDGFTYQHLKACARWASVRWASTKPVQARPTPAPGTSNSLCAPDPAEMGENTAVPPLPGRLRTILGLTRVLPSAAGSVRKLSAAKRKYQRKEKADPDAPPPSAPANHRAAAALGQLDTAVPRAYRLPRAAALPTR